MQKSKLFFISFIYSLLLMSQSYAFIVDKIQLEGLQRILPETIYAKNPIKVGEKVDQKSLIRAIEVLFKTGYFKNIQPEQQDNTLILKFTEHPTISKISFKGNKNITYDRLKTILINAKISDGDLYLPETVYELTEALTEQYHNQGRYNAVIEAKITPKTNNTIAIKLIINEGKTAGIKDINIVGAHAFTNKQLADVLLLKKKTWNSFFLKNNEYAYSQLKKSLEALTDHYLDHGYLNFQILSTQVEISPDKTGVYITINVNEDKIFKVKTVKLIGDFISTENKLNDLVTIKPNQIFSQAEINLTSDYITYTLGKQGYIYSTVEPSFNINNETQEVDVTLEVIPNKQFYVRYINFKTDLNKTKDEVFRREARQFEGALAESRKIDATKHRLNQLGFFKEVQLTKTIVPGTDNQVDLEYAAEEQKSGKLMAQLGYSQQQGLLLGGSFNQSNFLGSGNSVSFSAQTGKYNKSYDFSYFEPYFTIDGISRGFNVFYNTSKEKDKVNSPRKNYTIDRFGANTQFSYPISDTTRLSLAIGMTHNEILIDEIHSFPFIVDYLSTGSREFNTFQTNLSWSQLKLDYGILPTEGFSQNASITLNLSSGKAKNVYKLSYRGIYLKKLADALSLKGSLTLNYGNQFGPGPFPFYENFSMGGIESMRGFEYGSLGPQTIVAKDHYHGIGGNLYTQGSLALVFPIPFLMKQRRELQAQIFLDAGNLWATNLSNGTVAKGNLAGLKYFNRIEPIGLDYLRFSAGVSLTWISMLGPLSFSLAYPLKKKPYDDTSVFQFTMGHLF